MNNEVKAKDLIADLADTTPRWMVQAAISEARSHARAAEYPPPTVKTRVSSELFPTRARALEEITQAQQDVPDIAFLLSDATVTEGDPPVVSNKVLVTDGKINGTFPSGMGTGEYIIDIPDPSDCIIYAGVTFNPSTLAEDSWFLGTSAAADMPESRVEDSTHGFLYWQLGFTYFDGDGDFRILSTRVGDINFAFTYGSYNGLPGLLPVDSAPGWLDLAGMFP